MWLQRRAAVLADDQGLGKTASAVAYVASLLQEFKSTAPVLVVAPLATLNFWEGAYCTAAVACLSVFLSRCPSCTVCVVSLRLD
jgi:hypothetical protein